MKSFAKIMAIILCLVLMTACAGGNEGESETQGDKTQQDVSSKDKPGNHKSIELRIAHQSPETESIHKGFVKFKEVIESENVGVTVKIFPSSQLVGSDRDCIEAIKLNEIELTSVAAVQLAPHVDEFYVFNANYLFDDMDDAKKKLESTAGEKLKEATAKKNIGMNVATYFGGAGRIFWNNIRPIETLSDFEGIKVRTPENPINVKELESLGCIPTPMAWSEMYTGLQQGTIEGLASSKSPILQQGFTDVLKYATNTDHNYYIPVVLIGQNTLDKFDEKQKEAYEKAIKAATDLQWELAIKDDNDATEKIKKLESEEKITFTEIKDDNREEIKEAFINATEDMVGEKCGEDILSLFR